MTPSAPERTHASAAVLTLALILAIGWADQATGPGFPLRIAYLIPVALASWMLGLGWGIAASVAATTAGLVAASSETGPLAAPESLYWNAALGLSVLLLATVVIVAVRRRVQLARTVALVERERAEEVSREHQRYQALFHTVAHDARGPLTTILGMALTLERSSEHMTEEERDLLHRVAVNAQRLEELLEDMLRLDRSMALTGTDGHSGDLRLLARRLVDRLEPLTTRSVKLDVANLSCGVDQAIVERILENLLVNCLAHTPPGAHVWVRAWPESGGVVLAVEDDGPGVPGAERGDIFLAHRQGSRHGDGRGLGLSMVATFAELHGGRAWVEEREGGGASFRVLLPADGVVADAS